MQVKTNHTRRNSILRILFVGVSVLAQGLWLLLLILRLNRYSLWISMFTGLLSVIAVLRIHSHHTNTALKMP